MNVIAESVNSAEDEATIWRNEGCFKHLNADASPVFRKLRSVLHWRPRDPVENSNRSRSTFDDGGTVRIAAAWRPPDRVHVRATQAAQESDHVHSAAAAGAGNAVPENALSGRVSAGGSGGQDHAERG